MEELRKAGDKGPIKVVMGSIHSRLPVTHRERAFAYCMRELGSSHSSLIPEGIALECKGSMGRRKQLH